MLENVKETCSVSRPLFVVVTIRGCAPSMAVVRRDWRAWNNQLEPALAGLAGLVEATSTFVQGSTWILLPEHLSHSRVLSRTIQYICRIQLFSLPALLFLFLYTVEHFLHFIFKQSCKQLKEIPDTAALVACALLCDHVFLRLQLR